MKHVLIGVPLWAAVVAAWAYVLRDCVRKPGPTTRAWVRRLRTRSSETNVEDGDELADVAA